MSKSPFNSFYQTPGLEYSTWLGQERAQLYTSLEYEYKAITKAVGLIDASYQGVLKLTGENLFEFMEGIFSNLLKDLGDNEGQRCLFLSAKGKILGRFNLFRESGTEATLYFEEPICEEFLKSLNRYAFLSDIEVVDVTSQFIQVGLYGPQAARCLELFTENLELPQDSLRRSNATYEGGELTLLKDENLRVPGFRVLASPDQGEVFFQIFSSSLQALDGSPIGLQVSEILRVESGKAIMGIDFTEDHFPADAHLTSHLDYTKCYVGQEVVARMRTYGQSNRLLRGIQPIEGLNNAGKEEEPAETHLRPQDKLYLEEKETGQVSTWIRSPQLGWVGLAMLSRKAAKPDTELSGDSGNLVAKVVELPFLS